jgi:hypothetical protein
MNIAKGFDRLRPIGRLIRVWASESMQKSVMCKGESAIQ